MIVLKSLQVNVSMGFDFLSFSFLRAKFLIYSFLAFEVFLDDILLVMFPSNGAERGDQTTVAKCKIPL